MSSKVDICNIALGRIAATPIQSLTDKTKEANNCALYYDSVRKSVLRSHSWNFATEVVSLQLLAETPAEWSYAYQLPQDCLKVIEIVPVGKKKIPYKIQGKKLLANVEEVKLKYVKDIEDPTMFDDQFTKAFSYSLAADLAMPITAKPAFQNQMYQLYMNELNNARSIDASESKEEEDESLVDSRS